MKTIYLVTEGEYSDYHICGAFSSQKLADAYVKWMARSYDNYRVEIFPINEVTRSDYSIVVEVSEGGNILSTRQTTKSDSSPFIFFMNDYSTRETVLEIEVITDDVERAKKVAIERWTIVKALVEWGNQKALGEFLK